MKITPALIEKYLGVENVRDRFFIISTQEDDLGITHVKLKQHYKGIPIYGGEIIVHIRNNKPYFLNGYWYPEIPTRFNKINLRNNVDLKNIITNNDYLITLRY